MRGYSLTPSQSALLSRLAAGSGVLRYIPGLHRWAPEGDPDHLVTHATITSLRRKRRIEPLSSPGDMDHILTPTGLYCVAAESSYRRKHFALGT